MSSLYFRINFDWLTEQVRALWAEGEYTLAMNILLDSNIPKGVADDIIRGKKKMVQDPDGPEGAAGMVVDDDWQPDLSFCWMGKYPDPTQDITHFRYIEYYGRKPLEQLKKVCSRIYSSIDYLEKVKLWKELQGIPPEVIVWLGYEDILKKEYRITLREMDYLGLNSLGQNVELLPGVPDVDTYIKRQLELDKMGKPDPDTTFSKPIGWILPNGKFYSCEWMEHSWLTNVLKNWDVERAKKAGWVMITHPMGQPNKLQIFLGDKEPTQKQLDTLFEWEKKYEGEIINPPGEF